MLSWAPLAQAKDGLWGPSLRARSTALGLNGTHSFHPVPTGQPVSGLTYLPTPPPLHFPRPPPPPHFLLCHHRPELLCQIGWFCGAERHSTEGKTLSIGEPPTSLEPGPASGVKGLQAFLGRLSSWLRFR